MYLQLEQNILIPKTKVFGIFDLDNASWERKTKAFLATAQEEGRVFSLTQDLPLSFVLVEEDFGNITVYLSGKSSKSLEKRMNHRLYDL